MCCTSRCFRNLMHVCCFNWQCGEHLNNWNAILWWTILLNLFSFLILVALFSFLVCCLLNSLAPTFQKIKTHRHVVNSKTHTSNQDTCSSFWIDLLTGTWRVVLCRMRTVVSSWWSVFHEWSPWQEGNAVICHRVKNMHPKAYCMLYSLDNKDNIFKISAQHYKHRLNTKLNLQQND